MHMNTKLALIYDSFLSQFTINIEHFHTLLNYSLEEVAT